MLINSDAELLQADGGQSGRKDETVISVTIINPNVYIPVPTLISCVFFCLLPEAMKTFPCPKRLRKPGSDPVCGLDVGHDLRRGTNTELMRD